MNTAILVALCTSGAMAQTPGSPPPAPATASAKPSGAGNLTDLAAQFAKNPDTVVAEVNGTPITLGMIADRLHEFPDKFAVLPTPVVYKAALDDLIQQRAMAIKARELGLDKTPEEQRRVAEAADRELGQALIRRFVPEMITSKAMETLYAETIAGKPGPEEVRLRVIATATESDAMIALDVLSKGTDFGALAQKISKDPSAFNGGDVGYARRDALTPEIGAVAFALMPGQMTAYPVRSHSLWFLIKVEGRRQLGTPTLAESEGALRAELLRQSSALIMQKSRESVVVKDFGPTGTQGHDASPASKPR